MILYYCSILRLGSTSWLQYRVNRIHELETDLDFIKQVWEELKMRVSIKGRPMC